MNMKSITKVIVIDEEIKENPRLIIILRQNVKTVIH